MQDGQAAQKIRISLVLVLLAGGNALRIALTPERYKQLPNSATLNVSIGMLLTLPGAGVGLRAVVRGWLKPTAERKPRRLLFAAPVNLVLLRSPSG